MKARSHRDPAQTDAAPVTWDQVAAHRLKRHHLVRRAGRPDIPSVLHDIAGAQAQVLSAAYAAVRPRAEGVGSEDLAASTWERRTLARAWCMRRTMYLLPSDDLALFVRGTARRAEREVRWALSRGASAKGLERASDAVLDALDRPRGYASMAESVGKALGRDVKFREGGGWGSRTKVPCLRVGPLTLSVGFLLHLTGARGVVCCGPGEDGGSTFVRADRWAPRWRDIPVKRAEKDLLRAYLRAFGPATVGDFTWWTGMTASDAKDVWSGCADEMVPVDVEGWRAWVLRADRRELEEAGLHERVVRLLPNFDSFLLGHRSKDHLVDARHRGSVYRPQGWVAPTVLVDGRAVGVWRHERRGAALEVSVEPFSRLPDEVARLARAEAEDVGRFLGCPRVSAKIHAA